MPTTNNPKQPQDKKTKKAPAKKKAPAPRLAPEPVKPDADGKYAATTWGSDSTLGGLRDLEVPSGQVCLVKRPGVEGLLTAGVLENMDVLTSLVGEKVAKKAKKSAGAAKQAEVSVEEIFKDPEKAEAVLHTVNRVLCEVVIKPPIFMAPNDVTRRKSGVIYTDMVDLNDKMFIFQYVVGGSADLESFRDELSEAMGSLDPESGVEDPTE